MRAYILKVRWTMPICTKQQERIRHNSPCRVTGRKFAPHLIRLSLSGSQKPAPLMTIRIKTKRLRSTSKGVMKKPFLGMKMENRPRAVFLDVFGWNAARESCDEKLLLSSSYFADSSSVLSVSLS